MVTLLDNDECYTCDKGKINISDDKIMIVTKKMGSPGL